MPHVGSRVIANLCFSICCLALVLCGGCALQSTTLCGHSSFESYRLDSIALIERNRDFQTKNTALETLQNSPTEWRPPPVMPPPVTPPPKKGILLVHGLGDSPWSFVDIAPILAEQGFLVRAVLLPGNGTRPADMLKVSVDDWRRVVREQAAILAAEVDELYLGGFSAGCNLVLEYALQHPEVKGLVLLSPAFQSRLRLGLLAEIMWPLSDLLFFPRSGAEQQPTRYVSIPAKSFALFYESSVSARELLDEKGYDKPVFMVLAQHDMSVDSDYVLQMFDRYFHNAQSRLLWYGEPPEESETQGRILTCDEYVPELRVERFTHMAALFTPDNSEYGLNGAQRLCVVEQSIENYRKCNAGEEVWYTEAGYGRDDKPYARLTFNPHMEWQNALMLNVLEDCSQ